MTFSSNTTEIVVPKSPIFDRPSTVIGKTERVTVGCGHTLFITIGEGPVISPDTGEEALRPIEVFLQLSKTGSCLAAHIESLGRMVSLALRFGVPTDEIVSQLRNIQCPNPADWASSCADAVSRSLGCYSSLDVD